MKKVIVLFLIGINFCVYAQKTQLSLNPDSDFAMKCIADAKYFMKKGTELKLKNPYESTKYYEDAIKGFSWCIDHNYWNTYACFARGICKRQLNKYEEAIYDFNNSIKWNELNPKWVKGGYFIIGDYIKDEDGKYYLDIFNRTMQFIGNCYSNLGDCKSQLEDYRGAISDYSIAIQNIKCSRFYALRGKFKFKLNRYLEAKNDFTLAIGLDDWSIINSDVDLCVTYFWRAECNFNLGLKEDACTDFSKAGELGSTLAYDLIKEHCK